MTPETAVDTPELTIKGVGKTFGNSTVLNDINLTIRGGEFVGLMGPNGAGKSTLIKILDGVYTASTGEILVGGTRVSSLSDREDVGFIHQDLGLVDTMSVVDNLRLGARPLRRMGWLLDHSAERAEAQRALDHVGLDVSPDAFLGELSPGEKTLVAVARVLARGARIVFVDESTSTLPPSDARRVINSLLELSRQGASVVMVSHKLSEILDATTRVVILLDGRLASDDRREDMDRKRLVSMLLQHEAARADGARVALMGLPGSSESMPPASSSLPAERVVRGGEVVLEMHGVHGGRAGPVDLELRAGEIIGLSGLPGSGLHDVAFLAYGSMRPEAGRITRREGLRVALVPPHRESQGGFSDLDLRHNLTVSALPRWSRILKLLSTRRELVDAKEMVQRLNVQPPRIEEEYGVLSGGNKQKVVFGRALFLDPDLYVLCEPTRGVDVGTRAELYRLIRELRSHGAAVLVVSSDSEDLLALCDRMAVIRDGQLSELRHVAEMDQADLEALL